LTIRALNVLELEGLGGSHASVDLLHHGLDHQTTTSGRLDALLLLEVALVSIGAAVSLVGAAVSVGVRATTITT
jgi:hypothetical protein